MRSHYYIKQGRVLCERKTLVLGEKQSNSVCAAPFPHFASLVPEFLEAIEKVERWRSQTKGPAFRVL